MQTLALTPVPADLSISPAFPASDPPPPWWFRLARSLARRAPTRSPSSPCRAQSLLLSQWHPFPAAALGQARAPPHGRPLPLPPALPACLCTPVEVRHDHRPWPERARPPQSRRQRELPLPPVHPPPARRLHLPSSRHPQAAAWWRTTAPLWSATGEAQLGGRVEQGLRVSGVQTPPARRQADAPDSAAAASFAPSSCPGAPLVCPAAFAATRWAPTSTPTSSRLRRCFRFARAAGPGRTAAGRRLPPPPACWRRPVRRAACNTPRPSSRRRRRCSRSFSARPAAPGVVQEAASNHAVAMWGRSTEGFASDPAMGGLIFVMTRMQLQMERYPRWWVPARPAGIFGVR